MLRGTVDSSLPPSPKQSKAFAALQTPFIAPTLGVTFLGTSHGFDPNVCSRGERRRGRKEGRVVRMGGEGHNTSDFILVSKYHQCFIFLLDININIYIRDLQQDSLCG